MIEAEQISNIFKNYREHRLAHAFLIETNNIEKCYKDIKTVVKLINCPQHGEHTEECAFCASVDKNEFPEHMELFAEGQEIKKSAILELKNKLNFKPSISEYFTFIISECEKLNVHSSNSLLKFLEEPSDFTVGFLITSQKEKVLTTIRSRCQVIKAIYAEESVIDEKTFDETYQRHLELIKNGNLLKYNTVFQEKVDRSFLIKYYKYIFDITLKKMKYDSNVLKKIQIIKNCLEMLESNVNLDMCNDFFTLEMRELNE